MPEGPETRHSRDQLRRLVVGKRVSSVVVDGGRYAVTPPAGKHEFDVWHNQHIINVSSVDVKGKFTWWTFIADDNTTWHMWCTYGMSGRWTTTRPDKHIVATVTLDDQTSVSFCDPRRFGTLKFVSDTKQHQKKLASLGLDMLETVPTDESFHACLTKKGRTLAETLMDQSLFAGVGNYVKCEALHRAKLSPHVIALSVSLERAVILKHAIVDVMNESYAAKGATIQSYRTVTGQPGEAQFAFRVYGRKTDPLGHPVTREETRDGRTTHWCPSCQHE